MTAIPALTDALKDPEPSVRAAAADRLGNMGDQSAIQPLADLLANDADPDVREAAVEALGELGGPQAVAALGQGLKDAR